MKLSDLAHILQRRAGELYVHYLNTDKRLDEWIPEDTCKLAKEKSEATAPTSRKRKRGASRRSSVPISNSPAAGSTTTSNETPNGGTSGDEVVMTEEDYDIQHHKQITAQRNFDKVHFGDWQIKTW